MVPTRVRFSYVLVVYEHTTPSHRPVPVLFPVGWPRGYYGSAPGSLCIRFSGRLRVRTACDDPIGSHPSTMMFDESSITPGHESEI